MSKVTIEEELEFIEEVKKPHNGLNAKGEEVYKAIIHTLKKAKESDDELLNFREEEEELYSRT